MHRFAVAQVIEQAIFKNFFGIKSDRNDIGVRQLRHYNETSPCDISDWSGLSIVWTRAGDSGGQ